MTVSQSSRSRINGISQLTPPVCVNRSSHESLSNTNGESLKELSQSGPPRSTSRSPLTAYHSICSLAASAFHPPSANSKVIPTFPASLPAIRNRSITSDSSSRQRDHSPCF